MHGRRGVLKVGSKYLTNAQCMPTWPKKLKRPKAKCEEVRKPKLLPKAAANTPNGIAHKYDSHLLSIVVLKNTCVCHRKMRTRFST
mmetsp:Transcript_97156/g.247074  ORF Transcript_97156/g.247074 Transcript_97156/m.247074 type:complete len:86 (+) Transcript_97156:120-377(+)